MLSQGKRDLASKLLLGTIKIDNAIMSENYYITNLDIILISKRLNLPIIIVSSAIIAENKKKLLILNKSERKMYYFIKLTTFKDMNTPRNYKLFIKKNNILIATDSLSIPYRTDIRISEELNLNDYINSIKIPIAIKPKIINEGTKKKELEETQDKILITKPKTN